LDDPAIDRFEEPRDGDDELGVVLREVTFKVFHVAVDDVDAFGEHPVFGGAFKNVPAGEDGHEDVT